MRVSHGPNFLARTGGIDHGHRTDSAADLRPVRGLPAFSRSVAGETPVKGGAIGGLAEGSGSFAISATKTAWRSR